MYVDARVGMRYTPDAIAQRTGPRRPEMPATAKRAASPVEMEVAPLKRYTETFDHIHVAQERRAVSEAGDISRRRGGVGVCAVHRPDEHGNWHVCPPDGVSEYGDCGTVITVYRD